MTQPTEVDEPTTEPTEEANTTVEEEVTPPSVEIIKIEVDTTPVEEEPTVEIVTTPEV